VPVSIYNNSISSIKERKFEPSHFYPLLSSPLPSSIFLALKEVSAKEQCYDIAVVLGKSE
jgi:hypothetical protein